MRQIAISAKKIRGRPRRMRALALWARGFTGKFPEGLSQSDRFWNYKIPVLGSLVEGVQSSARIQAFCAQQLINACSNLWQARPAAASDFRVVANICIPDMYSSEVCIYTDPEYFNSQLALNVSESGEAALIEGRSIADEWGLVLPSGFGERGLKLNYTDPDDGRQYVTEQWFVGEVD